MSEYTTVRTRHTKPRLPLEGSLDLTYRCNNNCRHCWLRIPPGAPEGRDELGIDEIRDIVDQARTMGCREWAISGGEPMLRPDFAEIFDYVTRKATHYSINTNGTLITPQIAQLLKRKGSKMVALYGATAETYDHVTRHPGGFELALRGFRYLQETGAGFTVQLIPMRDNWHEWQQMQALAQSLSPHWRVGSAWLYLSASGNPARNAEIAAQRLAPRDVIALDQPDPAYVERMAEINADRDEAYLPPAADDRLFAHCIAGRRDFHVDPYGGMTFCPFIRDPALRYDLRQGSFQEAWDTFIPSLADKVRGGQEYLDHCAACELRSDCRWCPVYGYLEHRRFSAPVDYLCAVAREARRFKDDWQQNHRRYYQIAGMTVQVELDLPIVEDTFDSKFECFRVDGPGEDMISIRHHFSLPDLSVKDLGREVYRKPPWAIFKKGDSWIYLDISHGADREGPLRVAVFDRDHARGRIYNNGEDQFREGNLCSLTLFPSDQIWIARTLADRQGCYLHAAGVILDGAGLLFAGHPEAGKSTISSMLKDHSEILCDDRIIVRRWPEGFRAHGTWSHGDVPIVSASSAPLKAILFLEQASENRLVLLDDRSAILRQLLAYLIRPFVTADWWEKSLTVVEQIAREVPCYTLRFDLSGGVVPMLRDLCRKPAPVE